VTLVHLHDNLGARRLGTSDLAAGVDPLRLDLHLPPGAGHLALEVAAAAIAEGRAPIVLEVHPPRPAAAQLFETASNALRGY
jgi:sugar phosphate isomerase/epimerase